MKRALLLALMVPVVGPASGEGATAAGPPSFPAEARGTAALMLRLVDVPRGFTIGDDTGCGGGVENAPPALAELIIAHRPWSCSIQFEHWGWDPYIESFAVGFRTSEGAAALFALRQELFKYQSGVERITEQPEGGVGEEARLFLVQDTYVPGSEKGRDGAVVFWRRGAALGGVLVAGRSGRRALRLARRLARRQDARMLRPTPIRPHENDDLEVPLFDPRLRVPVRWLGRRFSPGRGLPPLSLEYTYGPGGREEGLPTSRARLEYESLRRGTYGVVFSLWRPRQWRRFSRSSIGRLVLGSRCAKAAHEVRLREGRGVVYAGYARTPRRGACPTKRPNAFIAHAYFGRLVVVINAPNCINCGEGITGRADPYNSVKGMIAVMRGLRMHGR